jgi:hypothetical protein
MARKYETRVPESGGSLAALVLIWLFASPLGLSEDPQPLGEFKFEVVSARQLTPKEVFDRTVDCIGCVDVSVRVRLTAGDRPLRFYTFKGSRRPETYAVKLDNGLRYWLRGPRGSEWQTSSPGMSEILSGLEGEWRRLAAGASIEWEEETSTYYAGQSWAFSTFLRDEENPGREVFSTAFVVPADTNPPEIPGSEFDVGLSCLVAQSRSKEALHGIGVQIGGEAKLISEASNISGERAAPNRRVHVLIFSKPQNRAWLGSFQIVDKKAIIAEIESYTLIETKIGWTVIGKTGAESMDDQVTGYVRRLVRNEPVLKYKLRAFTGSCSSE